MIRPQQGHLPMSPSFFPPPRCFFSLASLGQVPRWRPYCRYRTIPNVLSQGCAVGPSNSFRAEGVVKSSQQGSFAFTWQVGL